MNTPAPSDTVTDLGRRHSHPEEMSMRTMTCHQLGGPCNAELSGETADEVIKAQDRHLREAVRAGDAAHEPAHEEMKGRWRHPLRSMGWYRETKKAFAGLPEA
jgi:predicted small metal-binding protein